MGEGSHESHEDGNQSGEERPAGRISRRRFLELAGATSLALGVGPVLAACGGDDDGEAAGEPPAEPSGEPAAPAPSGGDGRPVKIGLVSPQTGPLAPFGETDSYIIGEMQTAFADGIDIAGTVHPIEIELKDTQSDPTRAAEVTQELIDGGVDLIIPGATPETTNPVGDTCEANGVPCLSTVAPWQPWLLRTPDATPDSVVYEWQWHFFWGLEDVIAVFVDIWGQVPTNMVVGGLWPNDGDGQAWSHPELGFPPALEAAGYTVVDPGRYENGIDDFSAQISQFKSDGVEIVTGVPIPPDFTTFWTQAAQQDFHPKAVTVGKALLFPSSVDALGDIGEGMSSEVWWHPTFPVASSLTGQTSQELADAWTAATQKQWTQPLGYSHAVFEVAADALKRTTNVDDPAAIRDAIAATNLDTVAGHVQWGSGPAPNVAKMLAVGGQWTAGAGDFAYDLTVVSNSLYPEVPTAGTAQPVPGS
jgi:branched-chain amino acid transport system substrate-binding protein